MKIRTLEEPNALNSVALFHETFKSPILDTPQIPDFKRQQLRVSLLQEEVGEFAQGIVNKDIVEIADALADIQYVLSGAILEFGLGEKFKELFDEVQRSNMSKACKTEDEAIATREHYMNKGVSSYYEQSGNVWLVFRDEDNKTLKSINYSPADLKSILGS